MSFERQKQLIKSQNLAGLFKNKCQEILRKQPQISLTNFFKENSIQFNTNSFAVEDMPFLQIMFSMPVKTINIFQQTKIKKKSKVQIQDKQNIKNKVKQFHQTAKFRQLLHILNQNIIQKKLNQLEILKLENIALPINFISQLNPCIGYPLLKKLSFTKCSLTDNHLQKIKHSLAQNISLTHLDLSYNCLQSGSMIGKILSEHSTRKQEIMYMAGIRGKCNIDLDKNGINQINLQNNSFTDHSIKDMITFLTNDKWTRSINLRSNKITQEAIKVFVLFIKQNTSLMNLDLRDNQGFTKQYSKYIYGRLRQNLQNYKISKIKSKSIHKKKSQQLYNSSNNFRKPEQKMLSSSDKKIQKSNRSTSNQLLQIDEIQPSLKGIRLSKRIHLNSKTSHKKTNSKVKQKVDLKNFESQILNKSRQNNDILKYQSLHEHIQQKAQLSCKNCKQMMIKSLKVQKANIQLQIQLKKLRKFISRNVQVSLIGTSCNKLQIQGLNPMGNISSSFHSKQIGSQNQNNDDQIISRMQVLLLQLTRIMQAAQFRQSQQTQLTIIENAFSQINSLSKTVSLYGKRNDSRNQIINCQDSILKGDINLSSYNLNDLSQVRHTYNHNASQVDHKLT